MREIFVVNNCGCSLLILSSVGDDYGERFLGKTEIVNGTDVSVTGYVGEQLKVMEKANVTGNCTDREATFQINDNFGQGNSRLCSTETAVVFVNLIPSLLQVIYIELGLKVFAEDITIRSSNYRLNDDFSLFYEMNALRNPTELTAHRNMRIVWQMRLFRKSPIVGLMENKLLCHSLLVSLGIPKAEIYYGAFASKAMGEWPRYDRDDFIAKLKKVPQVFKDHLFVIKPATGDNAAGTIIMNNKKWIDEGWSLDLLADHVEDLFDVTESAWGQKYEHLGVLIQQSVLSQESNTEFYKGSFDRNTSLIFEIKPHVVFDGLLCDGSLNLVPFNPDYCMHIDFCHGEPRLRHISEKSSSSLWDEAIRPTLQAERLAKTAKRIAHAFGVDLFRLDVFMDLNGMFLVNEVTYPSYEHPEEDCTYARLYNHYKHKTFQVLEPRSVLEPLLRRIGIDYDEFIETTDYQFMIDWTEDEWDSYVSSLEY
jgi:hypothetical protein